MLLCRFGIDRGVFFYILLIYSIIVRSCAAYYLSVVGLNYHKITQKRK